MNIARHVERGHKLFPDRAAIVFEDRTVTYAELNEAASRFANVLRNLSLSRGERLALLLPNSPEWAIAYLGAQKLGAIVVSLNPSLKSQELEFMLSDSGSRVCVTTSSIAAQIAESGIASEVHYVLVDESNNGLSMAALINAAAPDSPAVEMDGNDAAVIVYTSGTTGQPKGAVLSHNNVVSNIEAKVRYLGILETDRLLLFLPLFHCFGQNAIFNAALEAGATLVLHRQFDEARVRRSIVGDRVTMFFGVPTTYLILSESAASEEMDGIRYYFSAAANLPLAVEQRWRDKFGAPIFQGYGLTETSPFASYNHLEKHTPGSIGTPIENVQIKVIDVDDGSDLPEGQSGEIVIRGPNVMLGYWNRPEETAEAIRDGWFRTGDIGRKDESGYFFLEDRLKDMVNVGGMKVFPAEVENVLLKYPGVADVAVYGVSNLLFGERVIASVVLKPEHIVAAEEIRTFCRERVAGYKVPDEVEFIDAIPRNPTGKVLKRVLRDRYSQRNVETGLVHEASKESIESARRWIGSWLQEQLQINESAIDLAKTFFDYGLTSSQAMHLAEDAGKWSGLTHSATLAWKYPTVEELSRYLSSATSSNGRENGSKPVEKKEAGAAVRSAKAIDEFESQSVEEIAELLRSEIGALRQRKAR